MKTLVITLILGLSFQAQAFEKEDSFGALSQALMESSKDYNTNQKRMMDEENNRISGWSKRTVTKVEIESSIEEEEKDYQPELNVDTEKTVAEKLPVLHEVSMNN